LIHAKNNFINCLRVSTEIKNKDRMRKRAKRLLFKAMSRNHRNWNSLTELSFKII
jgi:hypothetical protein